MNRRTPLFHCSGDLASACSTTEPTREKKQAPLCMGEYELCSCLFTCSVLCLCKHIKVSVILRCVFCVYPWKLLLQVEGRGWGGEK